MLFRSGAGADVGVTVGSCEDGPAVVESRDVVDVAALVSVPVVAVVSGLVQLLAETIKISSRMAGAST